MAEGKKKIAVTGGAGSGKSLACRFLKNRGLAVVSADELARKAVEPGSRGYAKIVDYFGEKIVSRNGGLDRKKLRDLITSDPNAKKALESMLHPQIIRLMTERMEQVLLREDTVVAEVPLLFELELENMFDVTVLIFAPEPLRVERLMERDDVGKQEARGLMNIQMSEDEKSKRADYVIRNDKDASVLEEEVEKTFSEILGRDDWAKTSG